MSDEVGKSVCVIGAGAFGLAALKNLLEAGFEATAYERNNHIGGLWHVSGDTTQTTALRGKVSNLSKYMGCLSDFPSPKVGQLRKPFVEWVALTYSDTSLHPRAAEVQKYLESYATVFKLRSHIKLSTSVVKVERDDARRMWLVTSYSKNSRNETTAFDRLIIATGANNMPVIPRIPNSEVFEGEIIHSQQFKDPSAYVGKTVMVTGNSQTATDTVESLRLAGAKKLYMSHRRTFRLLPRMLAGKPTESMVTRRFLVNGAKERKKGATATDEIAARNLDSIREMVWPDLKSNPAFHGSRERPLMHASLPVVCDSIAKNLISGAVESVHSIDRSAGARSVVLKDGTEIHDDDAVIHCTGNTFDFTGLLPTKYDPTNAALAPGNFDAIIRPKHYHPDMTVCRAYIRLISPQEPHVLAFLGHVVSKITIGLFPFYDLISMALAQLWKGAAPMPTTKEMERECDRHFASLAAMLEKGEVGHTALEHDLEYDNWLHEVAGTGVPARLGGGGWAEWKFWFSERELHGLLMDGLNSPHAMGLFATSGRKAWKGARNAIEKANREVDEAAEAWKKG